LSGESGFYATASHDGAGLSTLEAAVNSLVKHWRIAGDLIAREHLAQNDIVVAGLLKQASVENNVPWDYLDATQARHALTASYGVELVSVLFCFFSDVPTGWFPSCGIGCFDSLAKNEARMKSFNAHAGYFD
jgi:hypothetical protein